MARLEVTWPNGHQESVKVSHRKPVTVGSHTVSDIVVDAEIAALACRIAWNGNAYEAIAAADDDLEYQGRAVRKIELGDGDAITIGGVELQMVRGPASRHARKSKEAGEGAAETRRPAPSPPPPQRGDENTDDVAADDFEAHDEYEEFEVVDRETKARIRGRLSARARRPGEREVTRSPLVYGMAGGVVVLAVATLALALFLRGQSIEQQFQNAVASHEAGRHAEAARRFEQFVMNHGGHPLVDDAERQLAITRVDQIVRSAKPDWTIGLSRLADVVREFRDDEAFGSIEGDIAERAGLIALKSAGDAATRRDPELIALSERAEEFVFKHSPDAIAPQTLVESIRATRARSRERLVQLDVLDEYLGRIQDSANRNEPLGVLRHARQLRAADAALANERAVLDAVETAREKLVRQVNTRELSGGRESTVDSDGPVDPWRRATVAIVNRPAGEARANGSVVTVWHEETLYALDRASGDPIWSLPLRGSFEPVEIEIPQAGLVAFDVRASKLVLLDTATGRLMKSVAIDVDGLEPGRPTVDGAIAFVPVGQSIIRADFDSGSQTAVADLGQPVLAEPLLLEQDSTARLLVMGQEETAFLLDPTTLELDSLVIVGHPYGSVAARPVAAAGFCVIPVNEPARGRCQLQLLSLSNASADGWTLTRVDSATVLGLVNDPPVLRGRDLFVASSRERVTVLTLSDEGEGRVTRGPSFASSDDSTDDVSVFLLPEADREFWVAGRRLRRLRATPEAIRPMGEALTLRQPITKPVAIGGDLYVASVRSSASTGTASRVNVSDMNERWQVQLGADVVGFVPTDDPARLRAVTENGDIVRMNPGDGLPFITSPTDGTRGRPLSVCESAGLLVVATETQVAWVGDTGRIVRRVALPSPPVAPICNWSDRVVVPIAGKLLTFDADGSQPFAEFWLTQGVSEPPTWTHIFAVDETHLVTLDDSGTARSLTVVTADPSYLAETATADVGKFLFAALDTNQLAIADRSNLRVFDPQSLVEADPVVEQDGSRQFVGLLTLRDRLFARTVSLTSQSLAAVDGNVQYELSGSVGEFVGARPGRGDSLLLTFADQVVVANGTDRIAYRLRGTASRPAELIGDAIVVSLSSGSVITLPLTDEPLVDE